MTVDHPVEQAIRRSHCTHEDRSDPKHQCVGTCLITPQGMRLECKACGSDDRPIAPAAMLPETRLVRAVIDALGIAYDVLSPTCQARAAEVAKHWMITQGRRT